MAAISDLNVVVQQSGRVNETYPSRNSATEHQQVLPAEQLQKDLGRQTTVQKSDSGHDVRPDPDPKRKRGRQQRKKRKTTQNTHSKRSNELRKTGSHLDTVV